MDALSQVLRSFRLRATFLSAWDLGAPWGLSFRRTTGAPFHYVESGELWLIAPDGARVHAQAGDMLVVFGGGGHRIGDRPGSPAQTIEAVRKTLAPGSVVHRIGGSGRRCKIVCGMFHIDERDSTATAFRQLPALLHVRPDGSLPRILDLLALELRGGEAGAERAAALLTETLLIKVIRHVLAGDEPLAAGWLAGLRDAQIAAALAAMHGEPEKRWAVVTLARRAGMSRTTFAARFHELVGVPPMTYLARRRLELAARWLRETTLSVGDIWQRLGYASAPAFHRAFKRQQGVSPSEYRVREGDQPRPRRRA